MVARSIATPLQQHQAMLAQANTGMPSRQCARHPVRWLYRMQYPLAVAALQHMSLHSLCEHATCSEDAVRHRQNAGQSAPGAGIVDGEVVRRHLREVHGGAAGLQQAGQAAAPAMRAAVQRLTAAERRAAVHAVELPRAADRRQPALLRAMRWLSGWLVSAPANVVERHRGLHAQNRENPARAQRKLHPVSTLVAS